MSNLETSEIILKVAARVGTNSFTHAQIKDLIPSSQYLTVMRNKGYLIREGKDKDTRVVSWRFTEKTLHKIRSENDSTSV